MKKLLLSTITFAMMLTVQAQPANKTIKIKVIESSDVHVYLHNGKIVVSGVDKESIYLYDIYGRLLTIKQAEYFQSLLDIPSSGLYLVKVGNHPAKKIVVIK